MSTTRNQRLLWSALIVGGVLIELSHRSGLKILGASISLFGFVGFLCSMLVDKIGNHRP